MPAKNASESHKNRKSGKKQEILFLKVMKSCTVMRDTILINFIFAKNLKVALEATIRLQSITSRKSAMASLGSLCNVSNAPFFASIF